MRLSTQIFFALSIVTFSLSHAPVLSAQEREKGGVQSGDIEIEETTVKRQDPYAVASADALKWARELPQAASGGGAAPVLEGGALVYVGAGYVHCVRKLGNCAFILDAILETDVLGARSRGDTKCPVSGKFWRAWLDNDMESRMKLDIPIGHVNTILSFNQRERPKYVRCEAAVTKALKDSTHSQSVALSLKKTKALFEEIETKKIDLLGSVGISTGGGGGGGRQQTKGKK